MRKISLLALFAAALFLQACYTVPVTGRSAFIMTSVAEEKALGLEAYNAYKTNAVVLNDYAINNRIRTIGQRIAKIAESDTQGMDRSMLCRRSLVNCRGPAPADPGYSKQRRRRRGSGNNCLIKR